MRALIIPAVAAAVISSTSMVYAAQATGSVKVYNMDTKTITLTDGTEYVLPKGFDNPNLKVGKQVTITWEMKDGKHIASLVSIQ
jgi:Protein of unknown function (DUF1344)